MALIKVPRPPKDAYNPDREAGSLLKAHMQHAHEAERKLPLRYRQNIDIYASAVRTEREAAEFLRQVTEAVHKAYDDAAAKRAKQEAKRRPTLEIAAAADETRPARKTRSSAKKKTATKPNAGARKASAKKKSKARK